jgi:hypothetical protein
MLVQLVVARVLACWSACLCLLLFYLLPFVLVQHVVAHVSACLSACLITLLCLLRRAGRAYARGCLHMYCDVPLVRDRRAFGVRVLSALPRCFFVHVKACWYSMLCVAGLACWFSVPGYCFTQFWRANVACLAPMVTQIRRAFQRAWLLWLLSLWCAFSVPGSYVVTLSTRGFRAEGVTLGKLSQLRKHGTMAIVVFPDFP